MMQPLLLTLDTLRLIGSELSKHYHAPAGRTYGSVYNWTAAVLSDPVGKRNPTHHELLEKVLNVVPNEATSIGVITNSLMDQGWEEKYIILPDEPDDQPWKDLISEAGDD